MAQFVIVRSRDHNVLGATIAYNHSFQDQHACLAVVAYGNGRRSPLTAMGAAMFIDYVFRCWSFRKLYLEVPEYNLGQFQRGVGRMFVEEGRLRDHFYFDGHWWDKVMLAVYRETWTARSGRVLTAAATRPARVAELHLEGDRDG